MPDPDSRPVTLAAQLAAPITVATPDVVGPLAVFALIADASPSCQYVSFAEGCRRGVSIKELQSGAQHFLALVHQNRDIERVVNHEVVDLGA